MLHRLVNIIIFDFAQYYHTSIFFVQKVSKSGFKISLFSACSAMCSTLRFPSQNSRNFRTDGRQHGTANFDYPTDVKSASRNKYVKSIQNIMKLYSLTIILSPCFFSDFFIFSLNSEFNFLSIQLDRLFLQFF